MVFLSPVLELVEGVEDLVGGLLEAEAPHLPPGGGVDGGGEGVDLGHSEPGQGGEHEVEQVLAHVDHDVVVLEDALFDGLTEKEKTHHHPCQRGENTTGAENTARLRDGAECREKSL